MTLPKPLRFNLRKKAKAAADKYSKLIMNKKVGKCYDFDHLAFRQGYEAGVIEFLKWFGEETTKKTRKRRRK